MLEENTTAIVQRYLDDLGGEAPAEPIIRSLLDRAVCRLHQLCASLLHSKFPRLARPPLNLQTDELLSAVVERLLKALREARPRLSASSSPWPVSTCAGSSRTSPDVWIHSRPP